MSDTEGAVRRCATCGRSLDAADDALSLDCGGDCLGCIRDFEADTGDLDAAEARSEITRRIVVDGTPVDPGDLVPITIDGQRCLWRVRQADLDIISVSAAASEGGNARPYSDRELRGKLGLPPPSAGEVAPTALAPGAAIQTPAGRLVVVDVGRREHSNGYGPVDFTATMRSNALLPGSMVSTPWGMAEIVADAKPSGSDALPVTLQPEPIANEGGLPWQP